MTSLLELRTDEEGLSINRRELVCTTCGYGAIVSDEPPACPMCRSRTWQERGRYVQIAA